MSSSSMKFHYINTNGLLYPSTLIGDSAISYSSRLIIGNSQPIMVFSLDNITISKDMLPSTSNVICLGNITKPYKAVYSERIVTKSSEVNYEAIKTINESTSNTSATNWSIYNGSNEGLRFSQNGTNSYYCIGGQNAAFVENMGGDLHIGNSNNGMSIYKSGALANVVCIGVSSNIVPSLSTLSSYKFIVNGISWSIGWKTLSDFNSKTNIKRIENACEKISKISGYTYRLKDGQSDKDCTGLIAQEVENVLPEAVDVLENGSYALDYNGIIALLVESIKELHYHVKIKL